MHSEGCLHFVFTSGKLDQEFLKNARHAFAQPVDLRNVFASFRLDVFKRDSFPDQHTRFRQRKGSKLDALEFVKMLPDMPDVIGERRAARDPDRHPLRQKFDKARHAWRREPMFWKTTIVFLCVTWVATPIVSGGLGFLFTRAADNFARTRAGKSQTLLKYFLFAGCCYAAYTLRANNTGNAVGVLYGTKLLTPIKAGFVGGIVMAIGALTWGRPILEKVAEGVVQLDLPMGVGAKLAQSVTAHTAAFLGYPTSMNQALIGGMAGAGAVRGVKTMNAKAMKEIVLSWFLTPVVAGIVSLCLYLLLSHLLGVK